MLKEAGSWETSLTASFLEWWTVGDFDGENRSTSTSKY